MLEVSFQFGFLPAAYSFVLPCTSSRLAVGAGVSILQRSSARCMPFLKYITTFAQLELQRLPVTHDPFRVMCYGQPLTMDTYCKGTARR